MELLLTAHPQDLNAGGGDWGSQLNAALTEGHMDIAMFLLNRGAVGDSMSYVEQTGLYIASSRGYADVVRSLIDHGADLNAICQDYHGDYDNDVKWTPLHGAIYNGHRDIAILILGGGADTEILSSLGQTALYMASSRGYADVVQSLIDCRADLNTKCQDMTDELRDETQTPLHVAIDKENWDTVHLLLEAGADTEVRNSWDLTALFMALSGGRADIVQELIDHGADLDAKCEYSFKGVKWTPLHAASCNAILPITRMLLEHGVNPNAPDNLGKTALHLASSNGQITAVELLLEYGANVDVQHEEGWTPLHEAAYNLKLQVVAILLNRGADPHAQTDKGETPIQLANAPDWWESKKDQAQIIRLLSDRTRERM